MANIVNKIGYAMSLREPQKEALSYLAAISENCNYQTDDKSTVEKVATQYCEGGHTIKVAKTFDFPSKTDSGHFVFATLSTIAESA